MTGPWFGPYNRSMFGFSLFKLLFLALVVSAVWYGFKYLTKPEPDQSKRPAGKASRRQPAEAEDMAPCRVCGTYVMVAKPAACARPDCPYRG